MSKDTIYREDAIKAIEELPNAYNGWSDAYDKAYIISTLEEVPKAGRPQGEVNAVEIYERAERRLERSEISLGEFESIIDPLRHLYYDRPQEWIPCSERLPSEKGMYLVTSREKATAEEFGFDLDDVEVKKMRFDEDGWRIPKHIPEWINGVVHTTVLAWMPLPEPWRGADDE